MQEMVGYAYLIKRYGLRSRPLAVAARIDSAAKGRRSIARRGETDILLFEPNYRPEASLVGHLQFALRYEGLNLEVLYLLFQIVGAGDIAQWLVEKPESVYARRAGFLYEWLTGGTIDAHTPSKSRYHTVVDEKLQFGFSKGPKNTKFRVINNLPGTREFCPLVRKTDYLIAMARANLKQRTAETLSKYDSDLLRRAAAFLYLKETQSSFELEREKPSSSRAQRFADLLRQAEVNIPLTEARLSELQNAVIDPRFHEFTWRSQQNWVGRDLGYRKKVDYVPPRPEDVSLLMKGLLDLTDRAREAWAEGDTMDPVALAACVAFGFVFIHPFMDGNGRIHRYLIHHLLAAAGFTPRGVILPVSAVILASLDDYVAVLEKFSRPMVEFTQYDSESPDVPAKGNDSIYYRFFDATEQAAFLYRALERTVEYDLVSEINFLLGFDRARTRLDALLDWPPHSLELFIRLVKQNGGSLSKAKRQSHFPWIKDEELALAESGVMQAFELDQRPTLT